MSFVFKKIGPKDSRIFESVVNKPQTFLSSSQGISSVQFRSGSLSGSSNFLRDSSGSYWNFLSINFYSSASKKLSPKESDTFHRLTLAEVTPRNSQLVDKFYDSGSVISIPQKYYGEYIKPKSFILLDNHHPSGTVEIRDDGHGNLYPVGNSDSQSTNSPSSSDNYVGNIFYELGIVTITDTGSYSSSINYTDVSTDKYKIKFDSTQTIYTHEYALELGEHEYNSTMNYTMRGFVEGRQKTIESTPYKLSDFTGSNFRPFFTGFTLWSKNVKRIGMHDRILDETEERQPIIIAKLPKPIQSPNTKIIFKIRLDQ